MTAASQSTRRKLSLLQLAEELGNVSKACKIMGYHRDTFYEVRRAFQVGGVAKLVEQKRGPRNPHPNRVAADIEQRILDYSLTHPTHGPQRVANQLRLENVNVSAGGVRGVWLRHDIETRYKRLLRLEHHAREKTFVLTEEQVKLLERHSADFRCRHVEASRPGELLNQDTFYWGTLKGVGLQWEGTHATVRDLVSACANAKGGVHLGKARTESEQSLLDWDEVFSLAGEEPSLAALAGICRITLVGLGSLAAAIADGCSPNRR